MNNLTEQLLSSTQENRIKPKSLSPYMTCAEAANYLRKSSGAMRNLVYRKQITAYKNGRRLLFKKSELDRMMEKCRVGNEFGY